MKSPIENSATKEDDLDRPLWGVEEIAREIKRTRRQTYHMLEKQTPSREQGRPPLGVNNKTSARRLRRRRGRMNARRKDGRRRRLVGERRPRM